MAEPATNRAGLPAGAEQALAAATAPWLREHPNRAARPGDPEAPDLAVWDTAGRAEILDALWDAGLLTVPGIPARQPLHRQPMSAPIAEQVTDQVADILDPVLREAALAQYNGSAWVGESSPRDLMSDADTDTLVGALWRTGLLVLDGVDDRAHMRAGWAAMGAALTRLGRGEDIPPDILTRIAAPHDGYLLAQQALRRHAADGWARVEAARTLVAIIRGNAGNDLSYMRTNLAVLQGLLAGHVSWAVTEPRRGVDDPGESLYDEVRRTAAWAAVAAERRYATAGHALLTGRGTTQGLSPDTTMTVLASQHLLAHRAALYAWGVAALLRYIRENLGPQQADDAAAVVDMIGEGGGDPPYIDDLERPANSPQTSPAAAVHVRPPSGTAAGAARLAERLTQPSRRPGTGSEPGGGRA